MFSGGVTETVTPCEMRAETVSAATLVEEPDGAKLTSQPDGALAASA